MQRNVVPDFLNPTKNNRMHLHRCSTKEWRTAPHYAKAPQKKTDKRDVFDTKIKYVPCFCKKNLGLILLSLIIFAVIMTADYALNARPRT